MDVQNLLRRDYIVVLRMEYKLVMAVDEEGYMNLR